jgi:hypothetical protein
MAIDLTLIAIPNQLSHFLQKAKSNIYYGIDFDKITQAAELRMHLQMIKARPDDTPESVIEELIEDADQLANWFQDQGREQIRFSSYSRGYATLNYLLSAYLKQHYPQFLEVEKENAHIFYQGQEIFQRRQDNPHLRFQYWTDEQTKTFYQLLTPIEFEHLLPYYDFAKMKDEVYKLTSPEGLKYLREEYYALKEFYRKATQIQGIIIIEMN